MAYTAARIGVPAGPGVEIRADGQPEKKASIDQCPLARIQRGLV